MLGAAGRRSQPAAGFLIDLDGTLVSAGRAIPGAGDLLEAPEGRFAVVSNDGEHTPDEVSRLLGNVGLPVPPDRIVLAGSTAVDIVAAEWSGARVLVLASASLSDRARRLGLDVIATEEAQYPVSVDVVLLGRDQSFSYAGLMRAANAIRNGADLVVTNPDMVHPGPFGGIVPETGALLQALLACVGPVPVRIIGKPQPVLFLAGLACLDIQADAAAMIGDNSATDGAGAIALGMRYLEAAPGFLPDLIRTVL
jgi:HAD superfamily hydrolase (TIGR01450 family)